MGHPASRCRGPVSDGGDLVEEAGKVGRQDSSAGSTWCEALGVARWVAWLHALEQRGVTEDLECGQRVYCQAADGGQDDGVDVPSGPRCEAGRGGGRKGTVTAEYAAADEDMVTGVGGRSKRFRARHGRGREGSLWCRAAGRQAKRERNEGECKGVARYDLVAQRT